MSILTFLLGKKEYEHYSHKAVMGPEEVAGQTFEVILYVRDAWYTRFPRLTRHNADMYHIRCFSSRTRFQVLPIDANKIVDKHGCRIKNPTFRQIVDMWWLTTPFAQFPGSK